MLKGEIEILAAILLNKRTGRQLTTSRLARHSPSIVLTLETLQKNRYIISHKTKGYIITDKGLRMLEELSSQHTALNTALFTRLLYAQTGEAGRAIRMIQQLGRDYESKINGS